MLKLDRIPLHWKTTKLLGQLCNLAGLAWYPRNYLNLAGMEVDLTAARRICQRHRITPTQAALALRKNYRWHSTHPGKGTYRHGDIPF